MLGHFGGFSLFYQAGLRGKVNKIGALTYEEVFHNSLLCLSNIFIGLVSLSGFMKKQWSLVGKYSLSSIK